MSSSGDKIYRCIMERSERQWGETGEGWMFLD